MISALAALLLLTPLALALLSIGTFELLISRNLVEATQALFAADAGVEWALHLVVNTPDWDVLPVGPAALVVHNDLVPRARVSVSIGKAPRAGDLAITSTGVVNRAQRTIQATIRRDPETPAGAPVFDRHTVVSWRER